MFWRAFLSSFMCSRSKWSQEPTTPCDQSGLHTAFDWSLCTDHRILIISGSLTVNKERISIWEGYSSFCFGLQTQSMLWISEPWTVQFSGLLFSGVVKLLGRSNTSRFCVRVSAVKCNCCCAECTFSGSKVRWKRVQFIEQLSDFIPCFSHFSSRPYICMTLEPLSSVVYLTCDLSLRLGGPGTVDGKRRLNSGWQRSVFCAAEDPWWSYFKLHHPPDLPIHLREQTDGNYCPGKLYETSL